MGALQPDGAGDQSHAPDAGGVHAATSTRPGCALVCGTDLANPNVVAGFSLHREMELFQRAGIPAPAVLRSATVDPGAPSRRRGPARRGRRGAHGVASMLLRKNPLEDVRNAAAIEGVFLRGRYYDRKALDAMLADVRAACGGAEAPASRPESAATSRGEPDMPGRPSRPASTRSPSGASRPASRDSRSPRTTHGFHVWLVERAEGRLRQPVDHDRRARARSRVPVGDVAAAGESPARRELHARGIDAARHRAPSGPGPPAEVDRGARRAAS